MDIAAWLQDLGLERYAQSFADNDIDERTLASLDNDDLKELGVGSVGHRKQLLRAIAELDEAEPIGSGAAERGRATSGSQGSPASYTPSHLAARILQSRKSLEGERKHVTVLFADIKGSTALIEGMDPEIADRQLEPVLKAMIDAVHRFEGTVNKVQGDGIMALFGAPLAHEDHAVRACYAGLAIQESLKALDTTLQVRVGLNSGEVLVRSIDNDLSMDYDAMGHSVHLAARMEQLAKPGGVQLTASTLTAAEGYIEVRELGPTEVKGVSVPIDTFELIGRSATRSRWEARASRGLTHFVGRETEMASLTRLLSRVGPTQGWMVAVVGEAGLGKSRLLHEFLAAPEVQTWTVHQAGAVSHGRTISYYPIYVLLTSIFGIQERDGHGIVAEKVKSVVETLDPMLLPILPALYSVLDVPVRDQDWRQLDPPQRQHRIAEAVKALALRIAEREPLLLLFEDLHWADSGTQVVLDGLVEGIGASQLMVVVTYRPEYQATLAAQGYQSNWGAKSYYSRIRLTPLEFETAERMLASLLGTDPSLERAKRVLFWRTEGRPLFLEETVRMLAEVGALEGENGSYTLAMDIDQIQIPATVKAVIAARIDCLPPEHKNLLQIASVFQRDVSFGLLKAISNLPEDDLIRRLTDLQAFEYLYERQRFPEREYTFKHVLTREVAYEGILMERRVALHRLLFGLLEAQTPDRLDEYAERLAHHATLGEVWDKAVVYLQKSGLKTLDRSNHREAVTSFEDALKALARLPESEATRELGVDLRLSLVTALGPSDEFGRMIEALRQALTLADGLNDRARIAAVNISLANVLNVQGGFEHSILCGNRALEIGEELDDTALQIGAGFVLGQANMYHGEFRLADRYLSRHLEGLCGKWRHARFGTTPATSVDCLTNLAIALAQLGAFEQARARAEEACQIGQETKSAWDLTLGHSELGSVELWQGNVDPAIDLLERAMEYCNSQGIRQVVPNLLTQLGHGYCLRGAHGQALKLLVQAVEQGTAMRLPFFETWARVYLGLALFAHGDSDTAKQTGEGALMLARTHNYRWHEVTALRLIGTCLGLGEAPDRDQALDHFQEAISLATALEMKPELAHCKFALGRTHERGGNADLAAAALSEAAELYRAMGMDFWLNQIPQAAPARTERASS